MPSDDESGRRALADVGSAILADVHPMRTDDHPRIAAVSEKA